MTDTALQLTDLTKRYRRRLALDGLRLSIPRGSIFGIVGSNGAGKTTTIGIVAGMIKPNAGAVDLLGCGPFDPLKHAGRISLMPQDSDMPAYAPVTELLDFYATLQGVPMKDARAQVSRALEWVHLSDRGHSKIRTLSHGMRRRVAIAQCFLGDPELILLDEPLAGLDPREVVHIRDMLSERRHKQTILVSSHNLHEIERICDRVAFIENGKTVKQDAMDTVTGRRDMLTYLVRSGDLPVDQLRRALPETLIDYSEEATLLTCRYSESEHATEDINRLILKTLLDANIKIIEVRRGSGLEKAYLDQPAAESEPPPAHE